MDNTEKLLQVAQLLKTVKVDGEYWALMFNCVSTVLQVAESLKGES